MTSLSITNMKYELRHWLRNSDTFSIGTRGVTTTTQTGTLTAVSLLDITRATVKNIRSVVVAGTTLVYGKDYTYDLDYASAPDTIVCRITFGSAKTGAYTVTYDYGSDKVHTDFPRDDLTLSSFPRLVVDVSTGSTEDADMNGDSQITEVLVSFYIYAAKESDVDAYLDVLRPKINAAKKSFYYLRYLKIVNFGPMIPADNKHHKIMLRSLDCVSPLNEEVL